MSARGYELDDAVRRLQKTVRDLDLKQARVRYGIGSGSGGDIGGGTPGEPEVTGVGGIPIDDLPPTATGDVIVFNLATGHWEVRRLDAADIDYDGAVSGSPETNVQDELDRLEGLTGPTGLNDLTDVVIASPLDKQRLRYSTVDNLWHNSSLVWEVHVSYDGTVVLDGAGNPVQTEVTY